jgi:shikimate dehydrogenase
MTDIFDFQHRDRYAVMGNPIQHSKSPQIHQEFAKTTQQKIEYSAIHVDLGGFKQAVSHFQGHGGKGLNVTVPFKLDAWKMADSLTKRAQLAGAVNTLMLLDNGDIQGDNTDGVGLVNDIIDHLGWSIKNKKVLILGAGGASRGIIGPILEQLPQSLFIANRTLAKATELAQLFAKSTTVLNGIRGGGYESLNGEQFDLVINATAASLHGKLPPLPDNLLTSESYCYDLMYASEATPFMRWAKQHQAAHISDGLGMLVGQAAESFALWRSIKPEVKPVIEMMRKQLTN